MKTKNCELIMTVKQMEDRDAWLKIRTSGIGGSDAGTIMGANPWKSPYQLWLEKTGQVEAEDIDDRKVRLQQVNNKIMAMMEDNEVGMTPAGARVTWKPQEGRTTIDRKKLAKDWPEAYEACKKVSKPIRVLRIKEADDNGND